MGEKAHGATVQGQSSRGQLTWGNYPETVGGSGQGGVCGGQLSGGVGGLTLNQ